jgi:hypothetical protein
MCGAAQTLRTRRAYNRAFVHPPQGSTMQTRFKLKLSLAFAALLTLPLAHAATMTQADYSAGKTRISGDYKADKTACGAMAGNAKDVCVEEAKAKEKVAKAELEFNHSGTMKDQNKVLVAKAESSYAVAKERCDDKAGNDKDVCVKEAKAAETKALADAKMGQEIGAAKQDAATDKRDADQAVAITKCDAMAGDAKASCVAAAKAKFGKM